MCNARFSRSCAFHLPPSPFPLPPSPFPPLRIQVLLKPSQRLPPPQALILRLRDPVSFVREVDQPARDSLPLERCEERKTFGVRNAVVEFSDHDEMRRVEIAREEMR